MAIFPKWLTNGVRKVLKAGKYIPVVKVIQADHGIVDVGQAVNKCIGVGDTINETTPAIRLMVKSCCDTATFISSFVGLVQVAGIAANIIQTYQGIDAHRQIGARLSDIHNTLEAQTTVEAQTSFANLVYVELWNKLATTRGDDKYDHWYIVYHPDTIWYAHFNRRIWEGPLSTRFCGYTNSLDMAVIFMLAIQEMRTAKRHGRSSRRVKLHLLIPAYQLLFIPEFVQFPEGLKCFVVEGATHNSEHLVWLNIPEEQNRFLCGIENWKPLEATFYQEIGDPLGRPEEDEDDDILSIASSTLRAYDSDDTPLDDDFSDDIESHA